MYDYSVDTLIVGATFYGCALAKTIPGSLVVESSPGIGVDFAYSFSGGEDLDKAGEHPESEEFRLELFRRRAALSGGRLLTGALMPVFADWCIRYGIKIMLGLSLTGKKKNILTFADFCGNIITISAKRVIDARMHPGKEQFFTAVLKSPVPLVPGRYGFFDISCSVPENLYYLSFKVSGSTSYQSARQRFAALWETRPQELKDVQIVWSAVRFFTGKFLNPVSALDCGLSGKIINPEIPDTAPPSYRNVDVAVCGFGTAGATAAISAARSGAKVLVIEKNSYPGGVWTGGFIPCPYLQKVCGIAEEVQNKAENMDGFFGTSETLKTALESAAVRSGVKIDYVSHLCGCKTENGRIKTLTYCDGNGKLTEVEASTFIDSTSEAVLCRLAGCRTIRGRESDMEFNSYTNTMGKLRTAGFGAANFDAGRIAQYDHRDFSRCYLETYLLHLSDDYSSGDICIQSSDNPGVREGDHIIPSKSYTLNDYFRSGGNVPETIFNVVSNLDTHAQDIFFESVDFQDWNIAASCWDININIPVPYSSLFPADVRGVIAASRHLGVDHDLGCAIRMISCMAAIGELSGKIASRAFEREICVNDLSYSEIEDLLLPAPEMTRPADISMLNRVWSSQSEEEIRQIIGSDDPATAIWNIRQQNKRDLALDIISAAPGSSAAFCAACGLAMLDDERAVPLLKNAIEKDDRSLINSNLRYSAQKRVAAVYLLGRLGKSEYADLLIEKLPLRDDDQFSGHLVTALIKIGDANVSVQKKTGEALRSIAEDASYQMIEQLKGRGAGKRRSDGLLRLHIARALDRWNIAHKIAEIVREIPFDSHEKWLWQSYSNLK